MEEENRQPIVNVKRGASSCARMDCICDLLFPTDARGRPPFTPCGACGAWHETVWSAADQHVWCLYTEFMGRPVFKHMAIKRRRESIPPTPGSGSEPESLHGILKRKFKKVVVLDTPAPHRVQGCSPKEPDYVDLGNLRSGPGRMSPLARVDENETPAPRRSPRSRVTFTNGTRVTTPGDGNGNGPPAAILTLGETGYDDMLVQLLKHEVVVIINTAPYGKHGKLVRQKEMDLLAGTLPQMANVPNAVTVKFVGTREHRQGMLEDIAAITRRCKHVKVYAPDTPFHRRVCPAHTQWLE